jgi:hypothetical protein
MNRYTRNTFFRTGTFKIYKLAYTKLPTVLPDQPFR